MNKVIMKKKYIKNKKKDTFFAAILHAYNRNANIHEYA